MAHSPEVGQCFAIHRVVEVIRRDVRIAYAHDAQCIRWCRWDAVAVPEGEREFNAGHAEGRDDWESVEPDARWAPSAAVEAGEGALSRRRGDVEGRVGS